MHPKWEYVTHSRIAITSEMRGVAFPEEFSSGYPAIHLLPVCSPRLRRSVSIHPIFSYPVILVFSHIAPLFSQLQNALYLNITSFPLAGTHGHFSHSVNAPQSCNSF